MTIASYSDLQASVATWIARSDLTAPILDFITLAETEFNRKLRVRQMMVTQSTTPSSGQFSLPSDYLAWVKVTWNGSVKRNLQYRHPSQLAEEYPDTPAALPQYFTVEGSTDQLGVVKLIPTDNTATDFTYYQKLTALSTSNTSNWLLTAHPDVYLAGALTEANVYVKDYDTALIWKNRRDDLVDAIMKLDQKTRGPSAIFSPGRNP